MSLPATEGPKPTYKFSILEIGSGSGGHCDEADIRPPEGMEYDTEDNLDGGSRHTQTSCHHL